MLENTKSDIKTLVLLKIIKKIIENSPNTAFYKLKKLTEGKKISEPIRINIPQTKKDVREKIKKEVKEKLKYIPSAKIKEGDSFIIVEDENKKRAEKRKKQTHKQGPSQQRPPQKPIQQRPPIPRRPPIQRRPPLPMPQNQSLPAHLQYLKPKKEEIKHKEIDLGKLNPFVQDKNVKTIETEGADEIVYVTGTMGKKPTAEKLSEEEIKEIIDKFSKEAKVPVTEGVFKVLVGHLQLTAMISESIGTRFIIKKVN